jgi:DNA-directed RNA polymerase specialized sigma24 family protein
MLKQLKIQHNHEDLFIERYERLMSQALHLTEGDKPQAQDLLHDAFIQFTLVRPDLEAIENMEGYLFVMLRNLRLSQVRRAAHGSKLTSLASYDSLEFGLRARDLRTQIQVQDELRLICQYATLRKETSKAGSVLILRFFHGYYPSETAQVLSTPRRVVDNWLGLARREARLYLENPTALVFMTKSESEPGAVLAPKESSGDLFSDIRSAIFHSAQGDCFSAAQFSDLYSVESTTRIDCARLAHLVSCATCLDEVNRILRLPSLSERNPFDVSGRDIRPKGGDGGGPGKGGGLGGSPAKSFARKSRREAKVTFEHRPEELRFSANGFVVGSLKIDSERSEQTISINLDEKISFVEVFSEQGMRLLLMNIEPPPVGPATQSLKVLLSDNRSLQLSLSFGDHWPTLQTVYYDPLLSEASSVGAEDMVEEAWNVATVSAPQVQASTRGVRHHGLKAFASLRRFVFDSDLWLKPATATVILALILIGTLFYFEIRKPARPLSARDLLAQSTLREEASAAETHTVLHRTINFEERRAGQISGLSDGEQLIARRKIEIWQSAEKGIAVRRLYDETGQLIAGDWRRADGVQALYHHGSRPRLQLAPEKRGLAPLSFDDVWQLEPSAREFTQLIGNTQSVGVEDRSSTYAINYTNENNGGLVKATLVLSRGDLHPIEETLLIALTGEVREYRFTEASFERHAPNTVAPAVFEPELELLGADTGTHRPGDTERIPASPLPAVPGSPVMATAELEVEVLRLLNQTGADLGEQINVTRTPTGVLRVEGLVESARRKSEILESLTSVKRNPAVSVDIQTVDEALKKRPSQKSSFAPPTVESADLADRLPVDSDLRRYFSARGASGEVLEQQIRSFAIRVANRSQQVQVHAFALRSLANRFSVEDLRAMDAEAKRKWRSMIRAHAQALARETVALRRDLENVFPAIATTGDVPAKPTDDGAMVTAIGRLFALSSACDQSIQSAFTISSRGALGAGPKSAQFWRTLFSVESFAAQIAQISD